MDGIVKIMRSAIACGFVLGVGMAQASAFDDAMEPILTEYLSIQEALASDQTEGIKPAVKTIEKLATKLDPGDAAEAHAKHYKNLPQDIVGACSKMKEANDIGATRQAFKQLSKPISMWVTMAKPKGKSVMYCPMAEAGWVQKGSTVANPYYGAEMLNCGEKVGGSE
jgi:Cu(I)/Ag(I) efflux system membrane fusion protein